MVSSRTDVEEGVVNYKGTLKHLYEVGGDGGCVEAGGVEAGTPMKIRNFSVVYILFTCSVPCGAHMWKLALMELRRILHCCISVRVLVLRWQWSLLAKYSFQCTNFCLKKL